MELMPWQRQVAEVATEYDPVTGHPFWRELFVTTPRQAGKSSLILLLLLERCLTWPTPQQCVWTGQDGQSIRRKWMNEIVPSLERSDLAPLIKTIRRSNGNEAVEWQTGSRIELLPTSETAGHGMVLDFAVLDEIFADHDNRREAALLPAMATRRDAQMLTCSTAGTAASTVYNRKVRGGRAAVVEQAESGLAYFEWSAPQDWDPEDDESFRTFHPAVGHTIDLSVIRQARETFREEPSEFARAYGNRPSLEGGDVIPETAWVHVVSRSAAPDPASGMVVAVDVSPDRDAAAIAVADRGGVAELVDYHAGVGWLVERAESMATKYGCPVVFDQGGPAGAVEGLRQLRAAEPMTSLEVVESCGSLFDSITGRRVTVRQDDAVDKAVRGLQKKHVGDRYCWSRKSSGADVTPLYAVTLALWAATNKGAKAPPAAMFVGVG